MKINDNKEPLLWIGRGIANTQVSPHNAKRREVMRICLDEVVLGCHEIHVWCVPETSSAIPPIHLIALEELP